MAAGAGRSVWRAWYGNSMKVTIDQVGRLLIPRSLRERIGLAGGGAVEIDIDGADLRIRPIAGSRLQEEGATP
jgi:AbrB family looped-hinge helix DNA binding protein